MRAVNTLPGAIEAQPVIGTFDRIAADLKKGIADPHRFTLASGVAANDVCSETVAWDTKFERLSCEPFRIAVEARTRYTRTSLAAEDIMADIDPQRTFRGLPLTPEQDAEVRHYIKVCKQHGKPWDTPELDAMLRDMLEPPSEDGQDENFDDDFGDARIAAERAEFSIEDETNPIEASEDWQAALESEAMKRFNH